MHQIDHHYRTKRYKSPIAPQLMVTLTILFLCSCEKNDPTGYVPTTDDATSSVTSSSQPDPAGDTQSAMRPAVAEKSDPSAIKAIDNGTVPQTVSSTSTATSTSQVTNNLNCENLAGGTWVKVPGDTIYGTSDFCVQKYIPSNINSVPTSQPGTSPWVTINFSDSKNACSSLGEGYHLISNPEWMTIAANIAHTDSNWSGGVVGSGELTRGHSDNSPAQVCQADANDANAWIDGTGDCTGKVQGSLQFRERRTRKLSNDSVIWDIGGNVWQWVDAFNPNNKPVSLTTWVQFSALGSGTADWPRSAFVPLNQAQSWWDDSWSSTQSIGQIYTGLNGVGGALRRGARWSDTTRVGIFSAYMELGDTGSFIDAAPRCAYTEATYSVTYDGNGATSGTVPTDSAKYSPTQPVNILSNSSSLAKSGYSFAGWNTAADGSGVSYSVGSSRLIIGEGDVTLYAQWVVTLDCSSLAGGTWIAVPADPIYGTSQFCVQKYIPSGTNTSQAGVVPRVNIDQPTARTACSALGMGYHLITNPEWMTIAANIANMPSNWSGGAVGSGTMSRGHSDANPNSACPADADDSKAWVQTSCTGQTQGTLAFNQRRTQNLSNGGVIWDVGGNVWQWVDYNNNTDKPNAQNNWVEYNLLGSGSVSSPRSHFVPLHSAQNWWDDTWSSTKAIGQIIPGLDGHAAGLVRGAGWLDNSGRAGPFAASLSFNPSSSFAYFSFRCAYTVNAN